MRPPVSEQGDTQSTELAANIALEFTIGCGFGMQLASLSLLFNSSIRLDSNFSVSSLQAVFSIHHT